LKKPAPFLGSNAEPFHTHTTHCSLVSSSDLFSVQENAPWSRRTYSPQRFAQRE
jgi:hypothetical protein